MATASSKPSKKAIAKKTAEKPDADHAPLDEKLVEEAVDFIKKTYNDGLAKTVTTIGDYVLKEFFRDDPAYAQSHDPNKNASYSTLSEKCISGELPFSKTWLYNAVSVAILCRALPEGGKAFKQLSFSQQTELLRLRADPDKVEKFAGKAVKEQQTVVDLREEVGKEVAKSAKDAETRGRKPDPIIVKTLKRSLKIFTFEGGKRSFNKADVDELTDEQAKNALDTAQKLAGKLVDLVKRLEAKREKKG